jgi:acyl carrier protein
MGVFLPDGSIEYRGRKDHQVKIRGHRVEVGEIETRLISHPLIKECVVNPVESSFGEKRLVAYVVVNQSDAPSSVELRQFLQERLPDYMIPIAYIPLDGLPLTPTGKIDRRALPKPDLTHLKTDKPFVPSKNETEESVCRIWGSVLGLVHVSVEDNFFELGGDSILATQVVSRIRDQFEIDLPLRTLFMTPTIAEVSEAVDTILWASQLQSTSQNTGVDYKDELEI